MQVSFFEMAETLKEMFDRWGWWPRTKYLIHPDLWYELVNYSRGLNDMALTEEHIEAYFTYHPPIDTDIPKYTKIREQAKQLALTIIENTPSSADQTAAIRKLRECVMTAHAAIACTSKLPTRGP